MHVTRSSDETTVARAPGTGNHAVKSMRAISNCLVGTIVAGLLILGAPHGALGQGSVRFDRLVAIGDGQTAGFQDGALRATSQSRSWIAILATEAGATFRIPLIGEPGIPEPNAVTGLGLLVERPGTCDFASLDTVSGVSIGRTDTAAAASNLAVPYHRIGDALERRWNIDPDNPNEPDAFEDFILGIPAATSGIPPRSQVETAVALNPTFAAVWLGQMDVLLPTLGGEIGVSTLLSTAAFEQRLVEVVGRVSAAGSEGVILNIPDVSSTALLVSAKELRKRTGFTSKQIRKRLGVEKTSFVLISALPTVDAIANGQAVGPLAASQILTKDEIGRLNDAVTGYNLAIERRARAAGWALVDVHALFDRYERHGIVIDGVGLFTTEYLGGLYSLDGYHLSNTGQVLVAAAATAAVNAHYGTTLPAPDVNPVAASDPHTCGVER